MNGIEAFVIEKSRVIPLSGFYHSLIGCVGFGSEIRFVYCLEMITIGYMNLS